MAINSWLEKVQFHELHPFSVKLFVLTDTYQWERYIVCNGIMVPVCVLNLYEIETWKLGTFLVCVSPGNLSNIPNFYWPLFSQINRLHWFVFPTAASAVLLL